MYEITGMKIRVAYVFLIGCEIGEQLFSKIEVHKNIIENITSLKILTKMVTLIHSDWNQNRLIPIVTQKTCKQLNYTSKIVTGNLFFRKNNSNR